MWILFFQEENNLLKRLAEAEDFESNRMGRGMLNWQTIADRFNTFRDSTKRLKREQIYQHFYHLNGLNVKCSPAETEMVHALDELKMPDEMIYKFLDNGFREDIHYPKTLSEVRELKNEPKPGTEDVERRLRFRRKVFNYIRETGWTENAELAIETIEQVRKWVTSDPKVKRKMHTVGQIGRPRKSMSLSESMSELAQLLRPYLKAYRWRQRISYHPGDIRKSALNSFTLHRLLGAPLEFDLLPEWRHSEEATVTEQVASTTKSLMRKRKEDAWRLDTDAESYFTNPDHPPAQSMLSPTLHTVTGIRGLLLHRKNLESSVRDEESLGLPDTAKSTFGNPESDEKLMRCMLSLFYWPMKLCLKIVRNDIEEGQNSDGNSDSDDEKCWNISSPDWPDV